MRRSSPCLQILTCIAFFDAVLLSSYAYSLHKGGGGAGNNNQQNNVNGYRRSSRPNTALATSQDAGSSNKLQNNTESPLSSSSSRGSRQSNHNNNRISQEQVRAPRVDSQLLRYVSSSQKKQQQLLDMNDKNDAYINNNGTQVLGATAAVTDTSTKAKRKSKSSSAVSSPDLSSLQTFQQNINGKTSSSSKSKQKINNKKSNDVSPFQRLNMLLVSILMHNGAGKSEAQKAADAVESHTIERFRRRQLRLYMKARDDSWSNFFQQNEAAYAVDMASEEQANLLLKQDFVSAAGFKNERIERAMKQLFDAGLTGKDCAAVLTHTPSLALSKDGNIKEGVDCALSLLSSSLGLRRYDARKVIRACPGLLTAQGSNSASQVVDMMSSLGVSRSSLARDKARLPLLLSRQPGALFRLAAFLASNLIRMPTDRVGPLLRRPECLPLLDSVVPVEYTLKLQASEQLDGSSYSKMIRDDIDSKYRTIRRSAELLREEFGIEDMAKIVSAYPGVLLLDSPTQIAPVVWFLRSNVGMNEEAIQKVLQSYPSLLKTNTTDMQGVIDYLISIDVSREDLVKIFKAFPSILTMDVEKKMKPVVGFLRDIGVVDVGRFVTRLPPILGYSVERELKPKWEYLTKTGFDYLDVVDFPAYFSYPFERVIRSRFEFLLVKKTPPKSLGLDRILRFGDEDFIKIVAKNREAFPEFKAFLRQREIRLSAQVMSKKKRRRRRRKNYVSDPVKKKDMEVSNSKGENHLDNRI